MHSSYKHTSSVDWTKLRLRISMPSSTTCLSSFLQALAGTETTYSSPFPLVRTATGIRSSAEYSYSIWAAGDSPRLNGFQLLIISWAPSGLGVDTSSILGAWPCGGMQELSSSRSGNNYLLHPVLVDVTLYGWLATCSEGVSSWTSV